jgi:hypothetical protein
MADRHYRVVKAMRHRRISKAEADAAPVAVLTPEPEPAPEPVQKSTYEQLVELAAADPKALRRLERRAAKLSPFLTD